MSSLHGLLRTFNSLYFHKSTRMPTLLQQYVRIVLLNFALFCAGLEPIFIALELYLAVLLYLHVVEDLVVGSNEPNLDELEMELAQLLEDMLAEFEEVDNQISGDEDNNADDEGDIISCYILFGDSEDEDNGLTRCLSSTESSDDEGDHILRC